MVQHKDLGMYRIVWKADPPACELPAARDHWVTVVVG